jgi:hypothetical protein
MENKNTDDKYSLDWLGCDGCIFNQGKPGWPVCNHPKGVRFLYGNRCINNKIHSEVNTGQVTIINEKSDANKCD